MSATTQTVSRIPGMGAYNVFKYVLRQNPPAPVAFTATALTHAYTIFGVPPSTVVVGVLVELVTSFTAVGMTSCSVMVGATDNLASTSNANFYAPAFGLLQPVSQTSFMYWSPFLSYTQNPHDITATFTSTGAQLASLTAGEVLFTVLYRPL